MRSNILFALVVTLFVSLFSGCGNWNIRVHVIKEDRKTEGTVYDEDGTGRVWYPARLVNGRMRPGYWGWAQGYGPGYNNENGTQLGKPFRVRGQMVPQNPVPQYRTRHGADRYKRGWGQTPPIQRPIQDQRQSPQPET